MHHRHHSHVVLLLLWGLVLPMVFLSSHCTGFSGLTTLARQSELTSRSKCNQRRLYSSSDDRNELGRLLNGIAQPNDKLASGSIVVAKRDIPSLGIRTDQAYELKEVYLQLVNDDGTVQKQVLEEVLPTKPPSRGVTQYVRLYSSKYHKEMGPVVVTPEEVGLVSLRDEMQDSVLFALPVLLWWLSVSYVLASNYTARYGGTFMDAFLGR